MLAIIAAMLLVQDTVTVRVNNAPAFKSVTFVEEVVIGKADGAEEEEFGQVVAIAVGRDNSIFVLDPQASVVRQFDANGSFIRKMGRRGSGPGEFRIGEAIALLNDRGRCA